MKITLLGTGAAFPDADRCQSSILVTLSNGRHFLFDCGMGTTRQLIRANVNPADVPIICFSHLHYDHLADFPAFIINGWMFDRAEAPIVMGPKGVEHFVMHLFEGGAFDADIRARSAYPSRQKNIAAIRPDVREIEPGVIHQDDDIRISCDLVDHIPRHISECFGFRIEADGRVVAYSGDTSPQQSMIDLARDADVLIHECTFPQSFIDFRAKTGVGIHAHTSPSDLGRIATAANVKCLVGTHFGHFESTSPALKRAAKAHLPTDLMGPHLMEEVIADVRKTYTGQFRAAHDLMRIDL